MPGSYRRLISTEVGKGGRFRYLQVHTYVHINSAAAPPSWSSLRSRNRSSLVECPGGPALALSSSLALPALGRLRSCHAMSGHASHTGSA